MAKSDRSRQLDDEFLAPEFQDALFEFIPLVRVFSFRQASRRLAPLYDHPRLVNRGREKTGKGWKATCNQATRKNLLNVHRARKLRILRNRDYGVIALAAAKYVYDSASHERFPAELLADVLHQQMLSPLARKDDEIFVNCGEKRAVAHYHADRGRSEFNAGQMTVSDMILDFLLSPDPLKKRIAKSAIEAQVALDRITVKLRTETLHTFDENDTAAADLDKERSKRPARKAKGAKRSAKK